MRRHLVVSGLAALLTLSATIASLPTSVPVDRLEDLTGGAIAVATLAGHDSFANEFRYEVLVRNQTSDPFVGDSILIVVDRITDLAARDAADRIEVVGQDGRTATGRPYFRIPASSGIDLLPGSESRPVIVRLRNPSSAVVFIPSFRVLGLHRPQPKTAAAGSPHSLMRC